MKVKQPTPLNPPLSRGKKEKHLDTASDTSPDKGRPGGVGCPVDDGKTEISASQQKPTPLNPPLSGRKRQKHLDTATDPPLTRGKKEKHLDTASDTSPDKGRPGGVGCPVAFLPYNKNLTALARKNRKNPTKAETKMWNEVLSRRRFSEFKFLRQKPLAGYIVDFYCSKLRLVLEIDGDSHAGIIEYDKERTRVLNALGVTVIRYTNDEVLSNIEGVYENLIARV